MVLDWMLAGSQEGRVSCSSSTKVLKIYLLYDRALLGEVIAPVGWSAAKELGHATRHGSAPSVRQLCHDNIPASKKIRLN